MVMMVVAMRMAMIVIMTVAMAVTMRMAVMMGVQMRLTLRQPRIFAEHQRLDRHRHGERRHAHTTEVDVVEVPERDAVEDQHLGGNADLFLEQGAKAERDVGVHDDEERPALRDRVGECLHDPACEPVQPRERRHAGPAKGERHLGVALDDVEALEVRVAPTRYAVPSRP